MNFSKSFARQPRALMIAEIVASLLVIAVLDSITSYQIRLLPFYAVPVFVLAWFCGKTWGIAAGLFSALLWWCANRFTGDPDLHSWIGVWEVSRHVGFFLIVALVGSALRAKSDIAAERIALLEHSQRLEREIVNISEAEQRRIGQDLHDGLCQYLAGLTCSASSLRDDLQRSDLHTDANAAGELVTLLQDAVVQTRDLARELVPAHVCRLGLVLALESLAQSVTRLHGVNCRFRSHASSRKLGGTHRDAPLSHCSGSDQQRHKTRKSREHLSLSQCSRPLDKVACGGRRRRYFRVRFSRNGAGHHALPRTVNRRPADNQATKRSRHNTLVYGQNRFSGE